MLSKSIFKRGTLIAGRYKVASYIGHYDHSYLYRVSFDGEQHGLIKVFPATLKSDVTRLNRHLSQQKTGRGFLHYSFCESFEFEGQTYLFLFSEHYQCEPFKKVLDRVKTDEEKANLTYHLAFSLLNLLENEEHYFAQNFSSLSLDDLFFHEDQIFLSSIRVEDFIPNKTLFSLDPRCFYWRATETLNDKRSIKNLYFSLANLLFYSLTSHQLWNYSELKTDDYDRFRLDLIHLRFFSESSLSMLDHTPFHSIIYLLLQIENRDDARRIELLNLLNEKKEKSQSDVKIVNVDGPETPRFNHIAPSSKKKGAGFDKIAGMDELKTLLKEDIIAPLQNREQYQHYGISLINGILFYGPPGCGKTFIAKALADEIKYHFIDVKPSDLGSIYLHGGQEKIANLFKEAEENSPTLIFVDEIDAILRDRGSDMNASLAGEVNEFLTQMTNCGERGIIIIGATNYPQILDKAILRTGRFDKKIFIAPPDHKARVKLFELSLKKKPVDALDVEKLAMLTTHYVASDISHVINEAAKLALKRQSKIDMSCFLQVIRHFTPSLTPLELEQYSQIHW